MHSDDESGIAVRHRSLTDLVYETLQTRILNRKYDRGERLAESVLAEELGVSRLPVREALRKLADEGLVEIAPRRSPVVAMPSFQDFLDVYDVRAALEVLSVRLAAQDRTDADLKRMETILAKGEKALASKDWAELANLNSQFHLAIAEAGGNAHLIDVVSQYRTRLAWMHSASAERRGANASQEWQEHRELLDALRNQDVRRVAELAEHHAREAREDYIRCFG